MLETVDTDHEACTRCRLPKWTHELWTCMPWHIGAFVDEDDMRRQVVLRELNDGALAGMSSRVTEQAVDMVLAVLNRYDAWKAGHRMDRTEWNGQPCRAERVTVVVADNPNAPAYWARDLVGTSRKAVRVDYDGQTFYIDDEGGAGWAKVTAGGSPRHPHRNLTVEPEDA